MIEAAEKLVTVIETMQEQAKQLAKASVTHGVKMVHKEFWENTFTELQEKASILIEQVKLHEPPEIDLPFKSDGFKKAWSDYCLTYYQQHNIMLAQKRQQYILYALNENYTNDEQAIRALKHHIIKADVPTYKVNFQKEKEIQKEAIYEEFS